MHVPNGYDEAPFSGSPTSTLSTPMLNCVDDMSADNAHPAENSATSTKSRLERVPVDNSASASGSGTNTSSSQLLNVENSRAVEERQQSITARLEPSRQRFAAYCRSPSRAPTRAEFFFLITKKRQNDIIISHQEATMLRTDRLMRWVRSSKFKKHFEFTTAFNNLPPHVRLNTDLVIEAFTKCGNPSHYLTAIAISRWPVQSFGYCHPYLKWSDPEKDRYSFRFQVRAKFCLFFFLESTFNRSDLPETALGQSP